MIRKGLFTLLFFISLFRFYTGFSQDTLRVVFYNTLNYGNTIGGCTNSVSVKNVHLSKIVPEIMPDIMGVCEMGDNALFADNMLVNVLQPINSNYKRATFTNNSSASTTNMLFYRSDKLVLYDEAVINHTLRDINLYTLYYRDAALSTGADTSFIRVVVVHLKAGTSSSDRSTRENQTMTIMSYLDALPDVKNTLVMGDFNIQSSSETSYQNMVNHTNTPTRMYDPISANGSWNNNASFAYLHTQSTRMSTEADCGSGGGMDDRLDFILANDYVINDSFQVKYVPGSYAAFGQDGARFDATINTPANTLVSTSIANALYGFSDHLPIIIDLKVPGALVSNVVSVDERSEVEIAGNPFTDRLVFRIRSLDRVFPEHVQISLIDQMGRVVLSSELTSEDADAFRELNTTSLSGGHYHLIIDLGKRGTLLKRVVKLK